MDKSFLFNLFGATDIILYSIYNENNFNIAQVVFPVPLLPITITLLLVCMTYFYWLLNLYKKLGIFYNNGTNFDDF